MEAEGIGELDVKKQAEQSWHDEVLAIANMALLPTAKSWYIGANIPGKPIEPLFYLGGLPRYSDKCANNNWDDFVTYKA